MEEIPTFPRLGRQLPNILKALAEELTLEPVWTLKQTSSKIYLDIVWTKSNFPPDIRPQRKENKPTSRVQQLDQVECDERDTPSEISGLGKKKKSPSTRRRDKQRREAWIAQKRSIWNNKCKSSSEPDFNSGEKTARTSSAVVSDAATGNPAVSEPTTVTPRSVHFAGLSPRVENWAVKPVENQVEEPVEKLFLSPTDSVVTPREDSPSRRNSESLDSNQDCDLSECWYIPPVLHLVCPES